MVLKNDTVWNYKDKLQNIMHLNLEMMDQIIIKWDLMIIVNLLAC